MRNMYINMLEKRAEDSQAVANAEHSANQQDQRSEVSNLFDNAGKAESDANRVIGKALPLAKKTDGTASSSPMLKVAANSAFFAGLRTTEMMKTASPDYIKIAYDGFNDELAKIASLASKALDVAKKPLASGSVVKRMPGRGNLTRHGTPAPKTAPLTLAEEARFANTPKQVGSGVWKIAKSKNAGLFTSKARAAAEKAAEKAAKKAKNTQLYNQQGQDRRMLKHFGKQPAQR